MGNAFGRFMSNWYTDPSPTPYGDYTYDYDPEKESDDDTDESNEPTSSRLRY